MNEHTIDALQSLNDFILSDMYKYCSLDIAEAAFQVLLEKQFSE